MVIASCLCWCPLTLVSYEEHPSSPTVRFRQFLCQFTLIKKFLHSNEDKTSYRRWAKCAKLQLVSWFKKHNLRLVLLLISCTATLKTQNHIMRFISKMVTTHQSTNPNLMSCFQAVEIKENISKKFRRPRKFALGINIAKFYEPMPHQWGVKFWQENETHWPLSNNRRVVPAEIIIASSALKPFMDKRPATIESSTHCIRSLLPIRTQ